MRLHLVITYCELSAQRCFQPLRMTVLSHGTRSAEENAFPSEAMERFLQARYGPGTKDHFLRVHHILEITNGC